MNNLKRVFPRYFDRFWPILLILSIVCLFFWQFFVSGKIPIPGDFVIGTYFPWLNYKWGFAVGVPVKNPIMADVVSFSFPMRMFAIEELKSGRLPLWNPFILGGVPLLANFQSAPFSPTNIIYFFTDKLTGWGFQVAIQHFFSALFTYLLLRKWKLSKVSAITGGVIYAFAGFSSIWSQWNAHVLVASFIPLFIYSIEKFLEERKTRWGIAISFCIFLQILSGYPQLVIYTLGVAGLVWLTNFKKGRLYIFSGLLTLIFVILGVAMASVQIFPALELLSLSQRATEAHPFEWAFLPFSKVITFIAPDYYGNHVTGNYWGPQDYTSNTGFVGVVATFLSIVSLWEMRKNKKLLLPALLVTSGLLLSFPTPISTFLWKSGFLGFQAAAAHRAIILFNLGVALLASFGLEKICGKEGDWNWKKTFASTLPIVFVMAIFLFRLNYINFTVGSRNLVFPLLILLGTMALSLLKKRWLFLILVVIELSHFFWKFNVFTDRSLVFPETPTLTFLKNQKSPTRITGNKVVPINMLMNYGIEIMEGYDAIYPASVARFISEVNEGSGGNLRRYAIIDNDTSELLDAASVKYVLALKSDPDIKRFMTKKYKKVMEEGQVIVFENLLAKPRAYFKDGKGEVSYSSYLPNKSEIALRRETDGELVVADTSYPGWKATLDGEEIVLESTGPFRGLAIPSGEHTLVISYSPDSVRIGVYVSGVAVLISLGLFFARRDILA